MNTSSKLILTAGIVILSILLVWPNIGERQIHVYFMPNQSEAQTKDTVNRLDTFLKEKYTERYHGKLIEIEKKKPKKSIKDEKKELDEIKFVDEKKKIQVYEIVGRFVQSAFLNELSRIKGVDGPQIELVPIWSEINLRATPFKLGLDLQGGMNLVLEGDFDKILRDLKDRYPQSKIDELIKNISEEKDAKKKKQFQFDLDNIYNQLNLDDDKKHQYMTEALEIIRARIDKTGVSEPLIRVQGVDKIEISLPGVASPSRAKKLVSSTASVQYRLRETGNYSAQAMKSFAEFQELKSQAARDALLEQISQEIKLPETLRIYVQWDRPRGSKKLIATSFVALEKNVIMTGEDFNPDTYAGFDQERLVNTVNFSFTDTGRDKFCKMTTDNKGRAIAISIDDKIRSIASINEPICGGQAMISGSFSPQEAKDLALVIKEGALPIPLNIVEENSEGPSLGKESISAGVNAILLGLMGVAFFMVLYYFTAGFIANLALSLNLLFMSAFLAWMDFTITLPGLAGVVLTLGMAVDANVIIYERIREELGRGKNIKLAVSQGFERATLTILDSNFTTMMAAIVLSKFGVGPIKGFAVTLLIGILTSLFTSLVVSRTIFHLLVYELNFKDIHLGLGTYRRGIGKPAATLAKQETT